jgi:putative ABC transport system permease protein
LLKKCFGLILKDLWFYLEVNLFLVLTVSLIAALLFFQLVLASSVNQAINVGFSLLNADFLLVPAGKGEKVSRALVTGEPVKFYFSNEGISERLRRVRGVDKVAPLLILESAPASCCTAGNVLLVAIDPELDFSLSPWIKKKIGGKLGKDELIVGNNVKRPLGLNLRFYNHRFKVKGALEPVGLGFYDNGVFMRLADAYRMAEETKYKKFTRRLDIKSGEVSALLIQQKSGFNREKVKSLLKKEALGLEIVELNPLAARARQKLSRVSTLLEVYFIFFSLVLLLILSLVFYLQLLRRERTLGMLEALGASRETLYLLVISEVGLVGLLAGFLGALAGWIILNSFYLYLLNHLEIPFVFPSNPALFKAFLMVILTSLLFSFLGSLYALYRLSREETYSLIREGKGG